MVPRSGPELLEDLINLNADEWNLKLAMELGVSVEFLRASFITRDKISLTEDKIKLDVYKIKIKDFGEIQDKVDASNIEELKEADSEEEAREIIHRPTKLDKFTLRVVSSKPVIESISATGKIIIGMDFSNAQLSDSFFCHCVFYNCDFTGADLGEGVFQTCVMNSCCFLRSDFRNAVITRGLILDCNFDNVTFDGSTISETAVIASQFNFGSFLQTNFLNSGFSECDLHSSNWSDGTIITASFTNCNINDSKFRRTRLCDIILIKVKLLGCDFDTAMLTSITSSLLEYDAKYLQLFKMNHMLFSPSVVEWEPHPENTSDDVSTNSKFEEDTGENPPHNDNDDDEEEDQQY